MAYGYHDNECIFLKFRQAFPELNEEPFFTL